MALVREPQSAATPARDVARSHSRSYAARTLNRLHLVARGLPLLRAKHAGQVGVSWVTNSHARAELRVPPGLLEKLRTAFDGQEPCARPPVPSCVGNARGVECGREGAPFGPALRGAIRWVRGARRTWIRTHPLPPSCSPEHKEQFDGTPDKFMKAIREQ
jgi:hypothetical protein